MYVCTCVHEVMWTTFMQERMEGRRRCRIICNLSSTWLWASMWVLGNELGFSVRGASALHHWVISSAPHRLFNIGLSFLSLWNFSSHHTEVHSHNTGVTVPRLQHQGESPYFEPRVSPIYLCDLYYYAYKGMISFQIYALIHGHY